MNLRPVLAACLYLLTGWAVAEVPKGCLSREPVTVVIRNDDVCALSQLKWEKRLLQVFKTAGMPVSVGFVPAIAADTRYKPGVRTHPLGEAPELVYLYRQGIAEGWIDVLQHGYDHQQNAAHAGLPPASSSEFASLPLDEQRQRIAKGRKLLREVLGVQPDLFIPPWNNRDDNTVAALQQLEYEGLSDTGLWLLDRMEKGPLPGRMIYFEQLEQTLEAWYRQGQCEGKLPPETVVVLYHSWSDYDPEGPSRLAARLQLLKDSGVRVSTLSEVLQKAQSPTVSSKR